MKKVLVFIFVCLLLVVAAGLKILPQTPKEYLADVTYLRQVVTANNGTGRTIMWQGTKSYPAPQVQYRLKGSSEVKTLKAQEDKFTEDKKENFLYSAELTGLTPGQHYEYRAGYGEAMSAWEPLTTDNGANFKALIFPDSQSSDYTDWSNIVKTAWEKNPDAAFFVNMGDLVDNGESRHQWEAWFQAVAKMDSSIPAAPIMGNHETYNLDWKVRMPIAYLHYFQLPQNNAEAYRNQYYSFDYGDVHFTVLNTQMQELDEFQPAMLKTQLEWFKKDMAQTQKKWKVVLMHKDVLQYGFQSRPTPREEGFSEEGKIFMPLFEEAGVDAVLTAHLHTYRRRGHIANFKRDAKGPEYIITGVAGNVLYPGLWKQHSLDEFVAPQPETINYMVMETKPEGLQFSCFLPNGQKLDTVLVRKN